MKYLENKWFVIGIFIECTLMVMIMLFGRFLHNYSYSFSMDWIILLPPFILLCLIPFFYLNGLRSGSKVLSKTKRVFWLRFLVHFLFILGGFILLESIIYIFVIRKGINGFYIPLLTALNLMAAQLVQFFYDKGKSDAVRQP